MQTDYIKHKRRSNKWTDAKITEKTGPLSYRVTTGDQGNWRRHADQMLSTSYQRPQHVESTSDVSVENQQPTVTSGTETGSANAQPEDAQSARCYRQRNRKPPDRLSYS